MVGRNNRRLLDMLECECPFQGEMRNKVIHAIVDGTATDLSVDRTLPDTQLLNLICREMESFLISYRTRSVFKQQLKARLKEWVESIERAYQLQPCSAVESWPDYVVHDIGLELVKRLQIRSEKNTKTRLAEAMEVDKKTIQNALRRLDPTMASSGNVMDPYRLGGQAVHVDISTKTSPENHREKYYYTANTLHPIALQMNVTQTAAILISLHNSVEREEFGTYCLDLAMDIWCQLTDYCKTRIEEIFTPNRPDFRRFIDSLKYGLEAGYYPEFRTEYFEAEGGTNEEILDYAYKTEHLCNLSLNTEGQDVMHQKKRIFKNENGRYFCASNDAEIPSKDGFWFTIGDVNYVTLL